MSNQDWTTWDDDQHRPHALNTPSGAAWDEAHDLTAYEAEIVEADQIDPPDADGDRPLTPEELDDLYRHSPMEHRV